MGMTSLNWKLPLGLLIAGGAVIGAARADSFTIVDGQVVNTTQVLNAPGEVGVVESGGVIDAPSGGITVSAGHVTVDNAGTISGAAEGSSIAAAGIAGYSPGEIIRNSGTVDGMVSGDHSIAAGINAPVLSYVLNSGTARGTASGTDVVASGISGDSGNTFVNEGLAAAAVSGRKSKAYGIYAYSGLFYAVGGNTIENSGLVRAQAIGDDSTAIGITVFDSSSILNSGIIGVSAAGEGASAFGITSDSNNIITNLGSMVVRTAGVGSYASGISAVDQNAIINHGVIDVGAVGEQAVAEGLWATLPAPTPDAVGNDILNDGAIRISAEGDAASARGIQGYNGNSTTNAGTLTVLASGARSNAFGVGFTTDGEIFNSGGILVQATGTEARSIGLGFGGNLGTIVNSGHLLSRAVGAGAMAAGIEHHAGIVDMNNAGSLAAMAEGESAIAYGINAMGDFHLTNTGVISATASGEGSASYGITASGVFGNTITNCGTIMGGTAAVKFEDAGNTLNLCGQSHIAGALLLGEGNALNVDLGRGANAVLHYEGSPTVTVSGAAHVVAENTVAVVDPTGFAAQDEMLTDLTRVIADSVDSRLSAARADRLSGAVALNGVMVTPTADVPSGAAGGVTFWAQALGQARNEGADGVYDGFNTRLGGLMLGADGVVSPNLRAGAFLGASASSLETDSNSQTIDANSYFGGLYAGLQKGAPFLNLGVTAGWSDQSSNRSLNNNMVAGGTEHAKADYGGVFISPSATLGTDIAMPGAVFTPSVRARYAALFLDSYDEHGSAADLSVDSRTVQLFDLRGQLALAVPVELNGGELLLTTRLGADGAFASDSDVNAELLGQSLGIQIDSEDMADGFAGLDAAYTTLGGTRFFVTTEFGLLQDATTTAQATAGVELRL